MFYFFRRVRQFDASLTCRSEYPISFAILVLDHPKFASRLNAVPDSTLRRGLPVLAVSASTRRSVSFRPEPVTRG